MCLLFGYLLWLLIKMFVLYVFFLASFKTLPEEVFCFFPLFFFGDSQTLTNSRNVRILSHKLWDNEGSMFCVVT